MTSFNIYEHATQQHIEQFKPTLLYIKQHVITGKLYFGKTVSLKNIESYLGSGSYWKNHIKKYGTQHVTTIWYCLFTDIESLVETAMILSETQNIIESSDWANLTIELGVGGWDHINHGSYIKKPMSLETRLKISNSNKDKIVSLETREKLSNANLGKIVSKETREKLSKSSIGREHSLEARENMRNATRKQKMSMSEDHKKHIKDALLGVPLSKERVEAMSKRMTGLKRSESHQNNLNIARRNRISTQESRQKFSANRSKNRDQRREMFSYYYLFLCYLNYIISADPLSTFVKMSTEFPSLYKLDSLM